MIGDLSPQQTVPVCSAVKRCKAGTFCLLPQTGSVRNGTKLRRTWDDLLPRRGYRIQPRVSTLGNHPNKWFALKGREIIPRFACRRPLVFGCFARSICRPFRARRLGTGFPGLKPRAESSRPLWGEEVSQIPLIFVPFNPGLCFFVTSVSRLRIMPSFFD